MFITVGTNLNARNTSLHKHKLIHVNLTTTNNYNTYYAYSYSSKDTNITVQNDTSRIESTQNDKFSIPDRLAIIPINFRINADISYLNFNHFVGNESKKVFFYAWLKEKEVKKLSVLTDSLRKVYTNASWEQKEEISSQILKAEEKSIALNEEIPVMYQKAWKEEYQYWQTVPPSVLARFQEKIRHYKDSIGQIAVVQDNQETFTYSEIPDTITLYRHARQATEKKSQVKGGINYKIQIGAYKGKVPEKANRQIKKISIIRKVENVVDDKGVKIYTTGNLRLYQEAVTMLSQVKQEGIKNAEITAYQNGNKITVMEARKLNNEL